MELSSKSRLLRYGIAVLSLLVFFMLTACHPQSTTVAKKSDADLAIEAYLAAHSALEEEEYYYRESNGQVKASIATQSLKSYRLVDKQQGIRQAFTASKGMSDFAYEYTHKDGEDHYHEKEAKTIGKDFQVEFGETRIISREDYLEKYGVDITEHNFYVTEDTILEVSDFSRVGEEMSFTLSLDCEKSVEKYKKTVQSNGGKLISGEPEFQSILLEVVISGGKFKTITYLEEYKVKALGFMSVKTNSNITETYQYQRG